MHRHVRALVFAAAIGSLQASTAGAQVVTQTVDPSTTPGWTFTPSLGYGQVADDNVLMQGKEATVSGDLLSVVTPKASLDYNGQRGHLTADYTGSFEFYRQFDSLDNFNQFEAVSARRLVAAHTSLFVQQQFAMMPTTALPPLAGIPYVRVGARILGFRSGGEHAFSKRTTLTAVYNFQAVQFDKDPVSGLVLLGGFGNGASATLRHQMTARTTILVDYDLERTSVMDNGTSTISNTRAGGEYKFSETSSVFAEGGIAWLRPNALTPAHTAPTWQVGVTHKLRRTTVDVSYSRGFTPSFGNGEAFQSDDVSAHLRMTVSRRLYTESSLDWRRDNPLVGTLVPLLGEQAFRSLLFSGLIGYPASPWLHIEGFFTGSRQSVNRPGGDVNVNRVGIQVVTGKPMRVR